MVAVSTSYVSDALTTPEFVFFPIMGGLALLTAASAIALLLAPSPRSATVLRWTTWILTALLLLSEIIYCTVAWSTSPDDESESITQAIVALFTIPFLLLVCCTGCCLFPASKKINVYERTGRQTVPLPIAASAA